jgi:hypothetical protein
VSRVARIALAILTLAIPVAAQDDTTARVVDLRARVPFGIGERAEYSLKYGIISAGVGITEVMGIDSIRGRETWHTVFRVVGGVPGFRINDRFESWIDTHTLSSLRHRQETREGSRERERQFEIYPDLKIYIENDREPMASVDFPLDDGSFLYFIRTIPLEVGEEYWFDRYFRPDRNPVRIIVLRRERITVPAGTFDAIVIRPIIKTRGVFSENGRAEVWLSDDSARVLLQIKSRLKFGSINLYLKSYRPAPVGMEPMKRDSIKKDTSWRDTTKPDTGAVRRS